MQKYAGKLSELWTWLQNLHFFWKLSLNNLIERFIETSGMPEKWSSVREHFALNGFLLSPQKVFQVKKYHIQRANKNKEVNWINLGEEFSEICDEIRRLIQKNFHTKT